MKNKRKSPSSLSLMSCMSHINNYTLKFINLSHIAVSNNQ
jgi:hypothetical protein